MEIKRDFRKLSPATQAELRRVAVAMVRAGKTRVEAAKTVGVNRRFVGQWVRGAGPGGAVGQSAGARRRGALGGWARGSPPGRAESPERGARSRAARPDRPGVSRSV